MFFINRTKEARASRNRWNGSGRRHIELPRPVLSKCLQNDPLLKGLYITSLGYYPRAAGQYTYRKKGLPENIIIYCVEGQGWYKSGKMRYAVGPGEFFILPQHNEHAYGSSEEDPWSIYWVHFGGEQLPRLNSLASEQEHFKPSYFSGSAAAASLFSTMYRTLELGYSTDNVVVANNSLSQFISLFLCR